MKTFEKGQWLYAKSEESEFLCRYESDRANGSFNTNEAYIFKYGELSDENNSDWFNAGIFTPATKEQYRDVMRRVAAAKGYVQGTRFKCVRGLGGGEVGEKLYFTLEGSIINTTDLCYTSMIYSRISHRWATIIKDEAEGERIQIKATDGGQVSITGAPKEIEIGGVPYIRKASDPTAKDFGLQDASDLKEFTKAAMQGLCSNSGVPIDKIFAHAVKIARATLSELKKG